MSAIFIHNLTEKKHWKGLWTTFGHHGDMVDDFVPTKRSRSGRRFGFVRYLSNTDAERVILRLNGFTLFDYRIEVSIAKFGNRTSYWRKINRDQWENTKLKTPNQNSQTIIERPLVKTQAGHKVPEKVQSEIDNVNRRSSSIQEKESRRKVPCYVEDETLWKLQRSLVGFIASENDSRNHPWSESFRTPKRIVWIELSGVPPHCWNHQTFKRVMNLWGELVFLGENAFQSLDLESMTLVLATKQWEKIETVIELEVGRITFLRMINESQSESSSTSEMKSEYDDSSGKNKLGNRDGINSSGMGNTNLSNDILASRDLFRQIDFQEHDESSEDNNIGTRDGLN
ncbi:hypothetical protein V6N13_126551 [Hibiscus sabdariffa]